MLPTLQEASAVCGGPDWTTLAPLCAVSFALSAGLKLYDNLATKNRTVPTRKGVVIPRPVEGEPCKGCKGARKLECSECNGGGRTNRLGLVVLPKNEFPVWCTNCRGSGLVKCYKCMGTGARPQRMGFRMPGDD